MASEMSDFFTAPPTENTIEWAKYQKNITEVVQSLKSLDDFTDNLENKVNHLLQEQTDIFVSSYKNHMVFLREQFQKMREQIRMRDQIIKDLQNTGKVSELTKRVKFLQGEEKKHLTVIENRNRKVKEAELQINIQKTQIKRLSQKVKELLKNQTALDERIKREPIRQITKSSHPTFSTQITQIKPTKRLSKLLTQQKPYRHKSIQQKSERSINPEESLSTSKINKELNILKKHNKELSYINTKVFDEINQNEYFLMKTINEIKKNIMSRKPIKECSYEDFRKEDKLQLLIKILSNEKLIMDLHQTIFGNKKKADSVYFRSDHTKQKIRQLRSAQRLLPTIKSSRFE